MTMRSIAVMLVVLTAFAALGGPAVAMTPFVSFTSSDLRTSIDIPFFQNPDGTYQVDNWQYSTSEYSVQLSALLDPDPSIAYGIAVSDFGAPSTFSFAFSTPIVAVSAPNTVQASIVGGLTDFTGDGVSLTPTGSKVQVSEVGSPLTNMGVDVGDGLTVGTGAAGALYTYGAFATVPTAGPGPGPWTTLQQSVSFTLSGGSDVAVLTGFASIEPGSPRPVPEPTSLALMAGGLVSLAALVRKRRAGQKSGSTIA
jgi:hypothetical protein